MRFFSIVSFVVAFSGLVACGSDTGTTGSGSGNGSGSGSSNGSSAGTCGGGFRTCTLGTLSRTQLDELCDTAISVSGVTPGTKKTCSDGSEVTLNDKAACVASFEQNQKCASLAALSGGQVLDCVAEGLKNPCAVLEGKACEPVKSAAAKCQ